MLVRRRGEERSVSEAWAGAGPRRPRRCWVGSRGKRREGGRGWAAVVGREGERGEIKPKWLYPFLFPFSFSQLKYACV